MTRLQYLVRFVFALVVAVATSVAVQAAGTPKLKRPNLTLYVTPTVAFAPVRVLLVAEVKGGADDDEEFYCPAIEWDWGDGTVSEASTDCPPFAQGKTRIQRRYSTEHLYREGGEFNVRITLKRNDRPFSSASNALEIRSALGDGRNGF
jgi:hypothetical protein